MQGQWHFATASLPLLRARLDASLISRKDGLPRRMAAFSADYRFIVPKPLECKVMLADHTATVSRVRAPLAEHSSRLLTALSGVAPGAVLAIAIATLCGEIGRLVHWRFISSAQASCLLLAVLIIVVVGALSGLVRRDARNWPRRRTSHVARVRIRVVATWVCARLPNLSSGTPGSLVLGGDHVRHLVYTAQEANTGFLDYGVNPYPRAWHTLVAMVWSASGARQDAGGLRDLVGLMSLGSWLLFALLSLATGHLAHAFAVRCGASATVASWAGLAAGAMTLWPSFLSNYQVLGFENSIVAALVLAVCAREVLSEPARLRAVVLCAAGVAVMANTWQLLLPASLMALGVVVVATLCDRPGLMLQVAGWVTLSGVVAAPGVIAVMNQIGIDHATDAGVVAPLPLVLLPLALCATAITAIRWRRDARVVAVAAMVLATGLSAPVLAARAGIPVTQYYPSKLLWSAGALGLAPLGLLLSFGAARMWHSRGALTLPARATVVAIAGPLLSLCAANPAFAVVSWPAVDGSRVLGTLASPGAGEAQVVWFPGEVYESTIARILLDFYRVGHHEGFLPQQPLGVNEECEVLRGSSHPAVLSPAPAPDVRERYSCVAQVRVIRVAASRVSS